MRSSSSSSSSSSSIAAASSAAAPSSSALAAAAAAWRAVGGRAGRPGRGRGGFIGAVGRDDVARGSPSRFRIHLRSCARQGSGFSVFCSARGAARAAGGGAGGDARGGRGAGGRDLAHGSIRSPVLRAVPSALRSDRRARAPAAARRAPGTRRGRTLRCARGADARRAAGGGAQLRARPLPPRAPLRARPRARARRLIRAQNRARLHAVVGPWSESLLHDAELELVLVGHPPLAHRRRGRRPRPRPHHGAAEKRRVRLSACLFCPHASTIEAPRIRPPILARAASIFSIHRILGFVRICRRILMGQILEKERGTCRKIQN